MFPAVNSDSAHELKPSFFERSAFYGVFRALFELALKFSHQMCLPRLATSAREFRFLAIKANSVFCVNTRAY